MSSAGTIAPSPGATYNVFAQDLIKAISLGKPHENVIYSPASIHASLGLAFMAAEGATAENIRKGLSLGLAPKSSIASNYGEFLHSNFKTASSNEIVDAATDDEPILKMANRIYTNENCGAIQMEFNQIAAQHFDSSAVPMNFGDAEQSAQKINAWVEDQTNAKIKNLLSASSLSADTSAVLVNAIYFKALWKKPFSAAFTHRAEFAINEQGRVLVDMMQMDEELIKYAELQDLNARAIELPYKNSDLSMLIILPNEIEGLMDLELKLAAMDLNVLSSRMRVQMVDVFLPKFKIEYDLDLKQPLSELGMSSMFSDEANFSSLFEAPTPLKIDEMRHKAYLEVNEAGSEAAAATFMKIVPMSLNLSVKRFEANHPFAFAIRNSKGVFFAGHVSNF